MKKRFNVAIIASVMSAIMFFLMPASFVQAAEVQDDAELKTVVVDLEDVVTGDAVVYATTSSSTKVLSKDYATSTGQTGTITLLDRMLTLVV